MINKQRLLTLFEELVNIDSPSFGEREVCDYLKKKFSDLGLAVYEDNAGEVIGGNCGNIYVKCEGNLDLPPILLSAHMDTVEPSRGKRMQTDEQGMITSVGNTVLGADDFAGVAAIVEGLTILKESGKPHRPIEILFSVAEEPYCVGIKKVEFERLESKEAYVFDLTGPVGGAAYQAPTIVSYEVTVTGRAAHAGFAPEDGIHAIKIAAEIIDQITCGKVGAGTVNVGMITGGTANNIVPELCRFTGEIRSFSDDEAMEQLQTIAETAKRIAEEHGGKAVLEKGVHFHAYNTPQDHPVVKRFLTACDGIGVESQLCQTYGGSDQNYMALQGITGIVVATAMNNCHSSEEYTTEDELVRAAEIALALMESKE